MKPRTRFTRLEEFYPAVTALVEWLQREGHLDESCNLEAAFRKGAFGSEVLGDLMLALKPLRGRFSPPLNREIAECYEFALHHRQIMGLS